MLFIFDLDGTTINSTHRHGDGTLADWQKNATDENVANDSLLPLATGWKQINRKRHNCRDDCSRDGLGRSEISI